MCCARPERARCLPWQGDFALLHPLDCSLGLVVPLLGLLRQDTATQTPTIARGRRSNSSPPLHAIRPGAHPSAPRRQRTEDQQTGADGLDRVAGASRSLGLPRDAVRDALLTRVASLVGIGPVRAVALLRSVHHLGRLQSSPHSSSMATPPAVRRLSLFITSCPSSAHTPRQFRPALPPTRRAVCGLASSH